MSVTFLAGIMMLTTSVFDADSSQASEAGSGSGSVIAVPCICTVELIIAVILPPPWTSFFKRAAFCAKLYLTTTCSVVFLEISVVVEDGFCVVVVKLFVTSTPLLLLIKQIYLY